MGTFYLRFELKTRIYEENPIEIVLLSTSSPQNSELNA